MAAVQTDAAGNRSPASAPVNFTITARVPGGGDGDPNLPQTGSDASLLTLLAGLLLALTGGGGVLLARRRR